VLTIRNINKIKDIEFSSQGKDWIVYGMEEQKFQYAIIFIPRDVSRRVWDITKTQSVYLTRQTLWGTMDSYKIESKLGSTYINTKDMDAEFELIKYILREELIK
jgi:hypothetical protein